MKTQYTYLFILMGSFLFPFIIGFDKRLKYNKNWKELFKAFSIIATFFVSWDILFTYFNVWGFNEKYVIGLHLFNLPIEEVLFFYIIPFCCLLIYKSLQNGFTLNFPTTAISYVLGTLSAIIALLFYNRIYTCSALGIAALLLFFIARKKYAFLPYFYIMFLISLIPFLIVNGLLTGTYLDEPIVWYNNMHNSSHRLLTIPYEDIFYGFDLLLLNVIVFEKFQQKSIETSSKPIA